VQIGHLIDKEPGFRHFCCLVREASATQARQNQRLGFQIEIKEAKHLATSTISIRQALNC
jgi:hypothetical protein